MTLRRVAATFVVVVALAGCASHAPAPVGDSRPAARLEPVKPGTLGTLGVAPVDTLYTVKKGDTLFGIALDHGVEYRELAAWNNIDNVNRIIVGQQLRVRAPVPTKPTAVDTAAASAAGNADVRPIALGGAVVARPLDGTSGAAAVAVAPAPTFTAENSVSLKYMPKGGKLPYSEENLARLQAQAAAPVPLPVTPTVSTVVAAPPEKPIEKPAETPVTPALAAVPAPVAATAGAGEIEWIWPIAGKLLATFNEGGTGQVASKGVDIAGKLGDPVQAAAAGKVVYSGSGLRGYGNLVIVRHNATFLSAYAHNSRILVKEGQSVTRGQTIAELGNSDADQPKLHFEVRQLGKPVDPLKFLPAR